MSECICLIAGIMLGGICGVTVMCILQINRLNDRNYICKKEEVDYEKNN